MTKFEFEKIYSKPKNTNIHIETLLNKLKYVSIFYNEELRFVEIRKNKNKYIFTATIMHSYIDAYLTQYKDAIYYRRNKYNEWEFSIPAEYILEDEDEEKNVYPTEINGKLKIIIPKGKIKEVEGND